MIDETTLAALARDPSRPVSGGLNGHGFTARIAIPEYEHRIARHYAPEIGGDLAKYAARLQAPVHFTHFGLIVDFNKPMEAPLHDEESVLADWARAAIERFGPLVLRNCTLSSRIRKDVQRNIFPNLRFHFDRAPSHPNQYSLYSRDPDDPIQRTPRESSTVFSAYVVPHLQAIREKKINGGDAKMASYDVFQREDLKPAIGDIILDQPWDQPAGTGEIAVIDNRTVLHASYYRDGTTAGYPIGTRYLY